jgi:hypothetical protein
MKLKPADLLDVATPKVITRLLSNNVAKKAWEDAVWHKSLSFEDQNDMLRVAKNPSFAKQTNPIALATVLVDYMDTVLSAWKHDSDTYSASLMKASIPLFVEMSKYLPHVNPADTYNIAFRGTRIPKVREFVNKNKNPKDWRVVILIGQRYMTYVGPKKNQFTYTPHRAVQSWSVSDEAASAFGNELLATPLDLSFFFDPKFLANYGYAHEKETIHFGKEPMKVALMIPRPDYLDYLTNRSDSMGETINESEQVSDEEGTLNIPM